MSDKLLKQLVRFYQNTKKIKMSQIDEIMGYKENETRNLIKQYRAKANTEGKLQDILKVIGSKKHICEERKVAGIIFALELKASNIWSDMGYQGHQALLNACNPNHRTSIKLATKWLEELPEAQELLQHI